MHPEGLVGRKGAVGPGEPAVGDEVAGEEERRGRRFRQLELSVLRLIELRIWSE